MNDQLKNIVKEIKATSHTVAAGTLEISSATEELAASTEEQSAQASSVSSAVHQLAATSSTITGSVDSSRQTVENSAKLTKDGSRIIQKSIESLQAIHVQTENLKTSIGNLDTSTGKIGNIIDLIDEVAEQTNLLALNAAIEAARAGDAGRGFAVVANEVKKLAERTANATKEIALIIDGFRKESQLAIKVMQSTSDEVEKGTGLGHQSLEILQNIVDYSEKILESTTSIANAIGQENITIDEISNNIEGIATASSESAQTVLDVAGTTESLSKQAETMQDIVNQFKTE